MMNATIMFVSVNFRRQEERILALVECFLFHVYATIERRLRNSRNIVSQFVLRTGAKREPWRIVQENEDTQYVCVCVCVRCSGNQ